MGIRAHASSIIQDFAFSFMVAVAGPVTSHSWAVLRIINNGIYVNQATNHPSCDFDLRATHARALLPTATAALASVSFGFVLIRVRVTRGVLI
jgi:hypothetical protein